MPGGFRSSTEKDIIRSRFDLPLLQRLRKSKGKPLSYFGLPGADALDIRTWKDVIGDVVAVERSVESLEALEDLLDTQLPQLPYTTHWGELDQVIRVNSGKERRIGGQPHQPKVGNVYEHSVAKFVWQFDVVYLDYFGPFIPPVVVGGSEGARRRADALRILFERDRVDAWQPWVLLLTVEARLQDQTTQSLLEDYLRSVQVDSSPEICLAVDFLLSKAPTPFEQAARLVHGSAAILISDAARAANLRVQPRGAVLYRGSGNHRMIHLAFEFTPDERPLGDASGRLALLLAPVLKPKASPAVDPWVELLPDQCPGVTRKNAAACLAFLGAKRVATIVNVLP